MSVLDVLKDIRDLVRTPSNKVYTENVTTGALSKKTTIGNDFPGKVWRLKHLSVTFNTAPTTSENVTLTLNALGANRPSTVLYSVDPSALSATSIDQIWEGSGRKMQAGDEVTVAYTNTDNRTVKVDITVEAP